MKEKPMSSTAIIMALISTAVLLGCDPVQIVVPPVVPPYAGVWKPTVMYSYGDSITECGGSSIPANCYVNRVAKYLGVVTIVNRSIGAEQACDVADRQVFPNDSPAAVADQPLHTVLIGTNDAGREGRGRYEATFNLCHQAVLSWLGTPSNSKVLGATVLGSATGSCLIDDTYPAAMGIACTSEGSTAQFPIETAGSALYVWYRVIDGDRGAFAISIDDGIAFRLTTALVTAISTVNGTTRAVALLRAPIAPGPHIVRFRQTSGGTMAIVAVGTASNASIPGSPYVVVGDVPSERNHAKQSAVDAYRLDIADNIRVLAGDGLNLASAPVGAYLKASSSDMVDDLHPNDVGHAEIFAAFASGINLLPGISSPPATSSKSTFRPNY